MFCLNQVDFLLQFTHRLPALCEADEGVKVLGLMWDESTSNEIITKGVMGTYDEETRECFKGTNVHMEYVLRKKDRSNFLAEAIYSTVYTLVDLHKFTVMNEMPFV